MVDGGSVCSVTSEMYGIELIVLRLHPFLSSQMVLAIIDNNCLSNKFTYLYTFSTYTNFSVSGCAKYELRAEFS